MRRRPRVCACLFVVFTGAALMAAAAGAQRVPADPLGDTATDMVREPAIAYFTAPTTDRVARLKQLIDAGTMELAFDPIAREESE